MKTRNASLLLGLVTAWGCAADAELPVSETRGALGDCVGPIWACYANSPEIDHYGFHELHYGGKENLQGIKIESVNGHAQIVKSGSSYDLSVEHGRIIGSKDGVAVLTGPQLFGAEIFLQIHGVPDYAIRIDRVSTVSFAVGGDTAETYVFSWRAPKQAPDGKRQLCSNPIDPKRDKYNELLGMRPDETLLFEADRIDATRKTIDDNDDPRWFNLGCAGHTLAKLHLTRHTRVAGSDNFHITLADRQATLKMLVADYCGTGRPFTVAGQPLFWRGGLVDFTPSSQRVEARWDERGATCLTVPRMKYAAQLPTAFQPDIWNVIQSECELPPPCKDPDPRAFDSALRVSSNP